MDDYADYDTGDSYDDDAAEMKCTNVECGETWYSNVIHEYDTNAHFLPDEAYTCPYCKSSGEEVTTS